MSRSVLPGSRVSEYFLAVTARGRACSWAGPRTGGRWLARIVPFLATITARSKTFRQGPQADAQRLGGLFLVVVGVFQSHPDIGFLDVPECSSGIQGEH